MAAHKNCSVKETDIQQLSKISKNTSDTYHLINGVSKNMQLCLKKPPDQAGKLKCIRIFNMKISNHSWTIFANGLKVTKVLEKLQLNMINLDRNALTCIADAMKVNTSIEVLDFSYNDISDANGDLIARIVSNQTQNRDSLSWKDSLRTNKTFFPHVL